MSIGFGEIFLILCVAFFVVGPKDMPKVARTLGRIVKKIRGYMKSINEEFENELDLEDAHNSVASANEEFKHVQEEMNRLNSMDKHIDK